MTELRYTKEHCWVRTSDDDNLLVGLTPPAVEAIGEVVSVELPAPGQRLKANQVVGMVESDWVITELYAPLDAHVIEVNESLTEDPSMLNEDPMGLGWLLIIRAENPKELRHLFKESAYRKFLKKELLMEW